MSEEGCYTAAFFPHPHLHMKAPMSLRGYEFIAMSTHLDGPIMTSADQSEFISGNCPDTFNVPKERR
jgi:hypothetical protein